MADLHRRPKSGNKINHKSFRAVSITSKSGQTDKSNIISRRHEGRFA